MSELIKHECGIACIRLRHPLEYYHHKYGDPLWGFRKLFFLMQKQRNRGHDGVGIGCCKIGVTHGKRYLFNVKSAEKDALSPLFDEQWKRFDLMKETGRLSVNKPGTIKDHFDFGGEVLMGHLRYSTSGGITETYCHPQMRESNWKTKSLMALGNFNLTNVSNLTDGMVQRGQHPFHDTDTQVVLEELGYHLDETHDEIFHKYRGNMPGPDIPERISKEIELTEIIKQAAEDWDGGYTIGGVIGNGDAFVLRDPQGIRPCFYFEDDEIIAFASERPPLMTVFDKTEEEIEELAPGHVASMKHTGEFDVVPFKEPRPHTKCSFERIYFSRSNDADIYRERKALGANLVPQVMEAIDHSFHDTVFSFIPNTAEIGYLGMMDGLHEHRRQEVRDQLVEAASNNAVDADLLDRVISTGWPRGEKIAHKDEKFRTFISNEGTRGEMVSLGYDICYGQIKDTDTLVALDDSIVRGTTLKKAIIKILCRLNPKRIVIVSTAPQIRYPDCYGIDMSELGKFLAFQSAIELLKTSGRGYIVKETYERCKEEVFKDPKDMVNCVKAIYDPFSPEEIAEEMARQVYPTETRWNKELVLIFQGIENLHKALPHHSGDWYFTGDFPTPGGTAIVNQAFINYFEGRDGRPYDGWL